MLKLKQTTSTVKAPSPDMSPNAIAPNEQNYSILIETPKTGGYRATALGLPNCRAKGATREIALQNVRELLTTRLSQSEIVTVKIDSPQPQHPWMQFAGMFQNDSQFEEMQADIEGYRQEVESQAGNK